MRPTLSQELALERLLAQLAAYQEQRDWRAMLELIERIADIDRDPYHRAAYFHTMGVIFRDELHDPDSAIDAFHRSLEADSLILNPRRALNALIGARPGRPPE